MKWINCKAGEEKCVHLCQADFHPSSVLPSKTPYCFYFPESFQPSPNAVALNQQSFHFQMCNPSLPVATASGRGTPKHMKGQRLKITKAILLPSLPLSLGWGEWNAMAVTSLSRPIGRKHFITIPWKQYHSVLLWSWGFRVGSVHTLNLF